MKQLDSSHLPALVAGLLAASLVAGCAPRQPSAPSVPPRAAKPAPDVYAHMVGTWWREHHARTQALRLFDDGRLELIGVPALRGVGWRVANRRLTLRMRGVRDGDLYEDELYIRRLTDRTMAVEAADSYFAGTYKRRRDEALSDSPVDPTPGATTGTTTARSATDATTPLASPQLLRRVDPADLPQRDAWSFLVADLGVCRQSLNPNVCPRFYSDAQRSVLLVEVCESGRRLAEGIHLVGLTGAVASYPWFDASFARFACENGCNDPESCRYEVLATTPSGRPAEVVYRFSIGPSWGWVRLGLESDGSVRVLEHRIGDPG